MNPILVEKYREEILESFHRGVICIVDEKGKVVFEEGDIHQICYPRSALKLIQILPLLESGAADAFGFTDEEIAIMCGSHNGEINHQNVVNSILNKIGLTVNDLNCGSQMPTLNEDKNALILAHQTCGQIHNNCSGKHAGFLALCKFLSLPTEDYINPSHPIQVMIKKTVAEMHEYPEEKMHTAIDGCSAPIFSLPVYNQALAYKNLIHTKNFEEKRKRACERVIRAVTSFPYMVGGTKRYCTEMMELCGKQIFGKTGADGVYSLGIIKQKLGVCIKIDDGLMGPQYTVAQAIIEKSGIFSIHELESLHKYVEEPHMNWNQLITGKMKINQKIFDNLPRLV